MLKGLCNGGQVTFGYKVNAEHCYEKDELTSPIVEQIFEMYSDGYKIKEIVDYLNEHNIRTYRNGKMTINIVQRMLSNRRYIGEYKFFRKNYSTAYRKFSQRISALRLERKPKTNTF